MTINSFHKTKLERKSLRLPLCSEWCCTWGYRPEQKAVRWAILFKLASYDFYVKRMYDFVISLYTVLKAVFVKPCCRKSGNNRLQIRFSCYMLLFCV